MFIGAPSHNFALGIGSPAIDAGVTPPICQGVKEEETMKKILLFLIILVSLLSIRTLNAATLADTNASAKATAIYNYIVDLPNHTQRVISGQWVGTDKTFLNSGFGDAQTTLADTNASAKATAIYNYIVDLPNHTQRVISGQWVGTDKTFLSSGFGDAQTVYDETGHWPGLIGAEYMNWHPGDPGYGTVQYSNTNPALINYWNAGGLVQVENHFFNPHTAGNYEDRDINFGDLLVAGTTRTNWLRMLDAVAAGLQELQNAGVVVLWRPFHEMNYGWFWWGGQDPDTFKAVWQDMFNYFTVTKGLHNLIWVYAPNAGSDVDTYYPGSAYADIVGLDGYTDKVDTANLPGYSTLQALKKPFSFPEFGPVTASSCPGTFDDMDLINGIKADFPNTIYWMSWRANQSIHCGLNATSLMTDSWVVNRDSNPSQQGGGSPRTIYVSVNGNDNNSCDIATTALNDNTKAKRNIVTPNGGLSCLSAGDTLDIRAGTYSEMMRSVTITIPSGTSDTQRTTIRGHAGETVNVSCIEITQTSAQFIIFDNLHIDGSLTGCSGMAGQAGLYSTNGANTF